MYATKTRLEANLVWYLWSAILCYTKQKKSVEPKQRLWSWSDIACTLNIFVFPPIQNKNHEFAWNLTDKMSLFKLYFV